MGKHTLAAACKAYGSAGTKALEEIVGTLIPDEQWLDELVQGCAVQDTSVVATWLLRATLERFGARGFELGEERTSRLIAHLKGLEHDDARLHVCQTVGQLSVPKSGAAALAKFLRTAAAGEHKFVRAWATDGFQRLAAQHPRYGTEARALLCAALEDRAPSVRARARHIAREFGAP